jgi:hypothetical protein
MADNAQIISQIRFALEQLSERNAEHEWEHLCRHLARARICSNILPATGPVQSGGDQGRDFETFRTYLGKSPLCQRSFVGLISEKTIAFACTIQKAKGIASKIQKDVNTIMSSGTRPESIHVLCTCDIAVAKRHVLQKWAADTHNVHLEIIDGTAASEFLCDPDLFWLAQRYLQLPSELLPAARPNEGENSRYTETLARWRQETAPAQTYAHFSEIRAAAREALGPFGYDKEGQPVNRHERPELPFWIDRLDELAEQALYEPLRRRAIYEATVLRLRGLGTLIGQEVSLRNYFSNAKILNDSADIEDFQVLLNYVTTANNRGAVQLSDAELNGWADALENRLHERIRNAEKNDRINEHCALLDIYGNFRLITSFRLGKPDPAGALHCWNKLAKLAKHAPLFPLERFADHLANYARYIGKHQDYEPLTEKVDDLLSKRFGKFKAAEKCLDRAAAFLDADDLPHAISQLHRAKIDWFAEETFGKALLVLNCISQAYSEQGLFLAAKYYALAAAFLAVDSSNVEHKRFVAQSLSRVANYDYALGAWHGFFEWAEATAIVYPHFPHDLDADFNKEGGMLQSLGFHLVVAQTATKILHPALDTFARERCSGILDRLGLAELKDSGREAGEKWAALGPQALWQSITEQLGGSPWSDAGNMRHAQWKAHGITWEVQWKNDYETTLVAEEFLAALQIFLSDLANHDLCLMRLRLKITLKLTPEEEPKVKKERARVTFDAVFEPSNTEHVATVTLPPHNLFRDGVLTRDDLRIGALAVASKLLAGSSLLPDEQFTKILAERIKEGLASKIQVGATYGQCFREFVNKEMFDSSKRDGHVQLFTSTPFVSRQQEKLPWFSGPGPGYDAKDAQQKIRNRYEGFLRPITLTLKRLNKELPFRVTVSRLRDAGWKDWHILSAVYHVTMNHRLDHIGRAAGHEAYMMAHKTLAREPEKPDALFLPLGVYEEKELRKHFQMFLVSFTKTYKLQLHQATPNFAAIEDFLTHRYNFWKDDVEHVDPFELPT